MTVQEYFRSLDKEQFIEDYLEYARYPKSPTKKQTLRDLLNQLDSLDIEKNSDAVIFSIPSPSGYKLDSYYIKKESLFKRGRVETYAYEHLSMTEVLGFNISKACDYFFIDNQYACSILFEMTWHGYEIEEQQKEAKNFMDDIQKQIEEIKSGAAQLISSDEMFEHLGFKDTRSEAEQLFDSENIHLEMNYNQKIAKALYKLERSYMNS